MNCAVCQWSSLIIPAFLMFSACTQPKPSDKISIDLSDQVVRTEDPSEEIVSLEFFQIANTSPIGIPVNIRLMDDRIIFVERLGKYRSKVNAVVAIDLKGNILWRNDKKGQGPGEFQYITDIAVLPSARKIVLYDPWSQKLIFLSTDGRYLNQCPFKSDIYRMAELDNKTIVANLSKGPDSENPEGTVRYDLIFLDHSGNRIKQFLPHQHTGKDWFYFGETLLPGKDELLYTNTLTYSIYKITPDGARPEWTMDFGRYNADTSRYLNAKTHEDGPAEASMTGITEEVLAFRVVHTPKNLWVLIPHDKKLNLDVINKKTHEISHYRKPEKSDFLYHGIPVPLFFLTQNGDKFLYAMEAVDAKEFWDALPVELKATADKDWRDLMEKLDPEGNPIIFILKAR